QPDGVRDRHRDLRQPVRLHRAPSSWTWNTSRASRCSSGDRSPDLCARRGADHPDRAHPRHGYGVSGWGAPRDGPVLEGDTLTVEVEVADKRETKKPDRGIVT